MELMRCGYFSFSLLWSLEKTARVHASLCAQAVQCTAALTDYIEPDGRGRLGDGDHSHRLSHGRRLGNGEVVGPLGEEQRQGGRDRLANPLYVEFDSRPQWGITAVLRFNLSGGSNIEESLSVCRRAQRTADQSL